MYGKIRNNQTEINQSNGAGDSSPNLSSLLRVTDIKVISNLVKKGWVLLHRRFWEDDDFPEEPFTELQAWAWLFSEACYEDKTVQFMNRPINLERGQLATTIRILAKRFKWGRQRIDTFLKRLEKYGKILRQPKDRDYTILTICKYDYYQNPKDNQNDSKYDNAMTTARQPHDNPPPRTKNIKEVKEDKERISSKPVGLDQTIHNKELQENIIKVYNHYIKYSKRNPNLYKLTKLRKQKIGARLKEGFTLTQMGNAIYAVLDNKFLMGDNDSGKQYIDIEKHIFKSEEQTEQRIREFEEKK